MLSAESDLFKVLVAKYGNLAKIQGEGSSFGEIGKKQNLSSN